MRIRSLIWIAAITASALTLLGATELVLIDGRVLTGTNVRRDGDIYVLTLENGEMVTMPADLVAGVRLTGTGPPRVPSPFKTGEPETLAGTPVPDGPTGLRTADPETLVGVAVRPPTTAEQLEVLGPPAKFQKDIIDPNWTPESAFDPNEDVLAASRSTWQKSPIDPSWEPESAFDPNEDVLASGRSTWQESPIDSSWAPTDGFASSISRK